jgi:hypothetical protein
LHIAINADIRGNISIMNLIWDMSEGSKHIYSR